MHTQKEAISKTVYATIELHYNVKLVNWNSESANRMDTVDTLRTTSRSVKNSNLNTTDRLGKDDRRQASSREEKPAPRTSAHTNISRKYRSSQLDLSPPQTQSGIYRVSHCVAETAWCNGPRSMRYNLANERNALATFEVLHESNEAAITNFQVLHLLL